MFNPILGGVKQGTRKFFKKIRKLTIWSLILKIAAVGVLMGALPISVGAGLPAGQVGGEVQANIQIPQVALKLDQLIPQVVVEGKVTQINAGESNYDREVREAREHAQAQSLKIPSIKERTSLSRSSSIDQPSLETKRALVKSAAARFGIDWRILEAVWQVETGKSWDTTVASSAGAQGPMQFMPGTWRHYAEDGNGDGAADIHNAEDAVHGAANYLARSGAADGNIDQALLNYNHSLAYVNKVKRVADSIVE